MANYFALKREQEINLDVAAAPGTVKRGGNELMGCQVPGDGGVQEGAEDCLGMRALHAETPLMGCAGILCGGVATGRSWARFIWERGSIALTTLHGQECTAFS